MSAGRMAKTLMLLAALAAVASCGRRSALDTPYEAAVQARKDAQKEKQTPLPPQPKKPDPDKPFILDKLIQ